MRLAIEGVLVKLGFVPEYRFAPPRRWRFDWAHPDRKVAIEIEGGVFVGGRHVRPVGYGQDCKSINEAAVRGWRVLRYTTEQFGRGRPLDDLQRLGFELDLEDPA